MAYRRQFQTSRHSSDSSWDPEKALAEALAEKAAFLNEHPEYIHYQNEIDRLLDKAGNAQNRMNVLAMLMEGKLIELQRQLHKLNHLLIEAGVAPASKNRPATQRHLIQMSKN